MKTLRIRTIQMAKYRKVNDLLDITIKSGDKAFAPNWDMVRESKKGLLSQQDYTDAYYKMMKRSSVANRKRWQEVIDSGSVTLACYCAAGSFCHRHLLAAYIGQAAENLGYIVSYDGEVE